LPNLAKNSLSLKEAVLPLAHKGERERSILALIGPEGDFTQEEIDIALAAGCRGVSLGFSVLRVDTAAIAVISFLKLFFES
jgi:16S rRNA (uracil1498-N3)-methyltransferase